MSQRIDTFAQECFIRGPGIGTFRFQFMPDEISDSKNANYNDTEIIGRSHPIKGYSSSGSRQLSFTLHFYMIDPDFPPLFRATALRALCYPQYTGGIRPPPVVDVVIGEIAMRSVLTSCSLTYHAPWSKALGKLTPMHIEAALTFDEVSNSPWEMIEVIRYQDMEL